MNPTFQGSRPTRPSHGRGYIIAPNFISNCKLNFAQLGGEFQSLLFLCLQKTVTILTILFTGSILPDRIPKVNNNNKKNFIFMICHMTSNFLNHTKPCLLNGVVKKARTCVGLRLAACYLLLFRPKRNYKPSPEASSCGSRTKAVLNSI